MTIGFITVARGKLKPLNLLLEIKNGFFTSQTKLSIVHSIKNKIYYTCVYIIPNFAVQNNRELC